MFYQIRYQTGEINDIILKMKKGVIPCVDVCCEEELDFIVKNLEKYDIYRALEIPADKTARDRLKEPEFEYRIAFYSNVHKDNLMYIDFYFEPEEEKTYPSIFGD